MPLSSACGTTCLNIQLVAAMMRLPNDRLVQRAVISRQGFAGQVLGSVLLPSDDRVTIQKTREGQANPR
jgi:hypothetical protein